jgi:hypothetical protein
VEKVRETKPPGTQKEEKGKEKNRRVVKQPEKKM